VIGWSPSSWLVWYAAAQCEIWNEAQASVGLAPSASPEDAAACVQVVAQKQPCLAEEEGKVRTWFDATANPA